MNLNFKILFFICMFNYVLVTLAMPESAGNGKNANGQKKLTFRYFGYGSNLLAKRIQIQNPTAVRVEPGLLKVNFICIINHWAINIYKNE